MWGCLARQPIDFFTCSWIKIGFQQFTVVRFCGKAKAEKSYERCICGSMAGSCRRKNCAWA
jgi:hypothetical protein